MPLTNFPFGISSFGMPVIGGTNVFSGTHFAVDSVNGADGNTGSFDRPFATLEKAINSCTSGAGDVIYVKAGHAENIASATALNFDVAGVTIIGLGTGNARPTFTFTTANTATIPVSAANIEVRNCVFKSNFLSVAAAFTLTTAKAFTVLDCEFVDLSGVLNFLNIFKSTGAANTVDGLRVERCKWHGLGTTSVNSFILTANDIDGAVVRNNFVKLAKTTDTSILMTVTAGVLTNLDCGDNKVYSAQTATTAGSLIDVGGTTSNGCVYRNFAQTLTVAADKLFTVTAGLSAFENYVTGAVGASGFIIPARDT